MMTQLFASWSTISSQFLLSFGLFLPRLVGALAVFFIGILLAKYLRQLLHKLLGAINLAGMVGQTPVQAALDNPEVGKKIEATIANLIYWLALLLVLHTTAAVLNISSITLLIEKILNYLPQVLSAVLILGFGVILAGLVESLVKGAVRSIGISQAIWLGKISSYLVICIAVLSSLSELGIAKDFITILFIGFISTLSLALGLALGLGGKDTIHKLLTRWYDQTFPVSPKVNSKTK